MLFALKVVKHAQALNQESDFSDVHIRIAKMKNFDDRRPSLDSGLRSASVGEEAGQVLDPGQHGSGGNGTGQAMMDRWHNSYCSRSF